MTDAEKTQVQPSPELTPEQQEDERLWKLYNNTDFTFTMKGTDVNNLLALISELPRRRAAMTINRVNKVVNDQFNAIIKAEKEAKETPVEEKE